ncbi:hypothetical protein A3B45_00425 [Candidatus Daviesbacteria bacterium RIFCSPLOWO2_01_FULL_39_12]|uniref:Glycosyltransferase subfamily 4-like N-terminal domain-containing protein n=1 Tax=Candidatus Daviesbacteria bacterium RIFCSPLOWO2_01_FULL_39_12 TaxID=1797785 RepID=A0A1F5KP85_9BACT|nr:MAG: hypothetical protein A3B45_00425 [Candidatus Daviesbacteria bacterium RIFCSPLOWO2_01_FULL_39_12]
MSKVLQLTAHFPPNVGGVETHLDDLVKVLIKRGWEVTVLTYQPLTTKVDWKMIEKKRHLLIFRIFWIKGFFYKLVKYPLLEFLYLLPGLFFLSPLFILVRNPQVIHAHGLVAGFAAVFWGKVFDKKVIISTHSIYSFPKNGLYRYFVSWIFKNASLCFGLSKQAVEEIKSLGIPSEKVDNFTYWIDLKKFHTIKQLRRNKRFTVLFVGRLVAEKGINELLESVKSWKREINLKIVGSGPLEGKIKEFTQKYKNVELVGVLDQDKLPIYYGKSDILIVPSVSEEGFGRVILESLACGLPVIGSNRGAVPEAMDDSVGRLIDVSPENIRTAVEYFYTHRDELRRMAKNCRKFAERRYSEKNAEKIIRAYQE